MNINNLCNSGEEIVETERLIMKRITNDDEYNTIWDRLFTEFQDNVRRSLAECEL